MTRIEREQWGLTWNMGLESGGVLVGKTMRAVEEYGCRRVLIGGGVAASRPLRNALAAALGVSMPPTATGHVLPVLRSGFARPRVVFVLVLDGMRRDYFDRYADVMPTLSALRRRAAWFSQAHMNVLPTNTAVGHSTIATGTGSHRPGSRSMPRSSSITRPIFRPAGAPSTRFAPTSTGSTCSATNAR